MSHFSTTDLGISNLQDLIAAIEAAGLTAVQPEPGEETVQIVGWQGQKRRAALKLAGGDLNRYGFEIGFRFDDRRGVYTMISDWMGAKVNPYELAERLNNAAAEVGALAELAALGYDLSEITITRENGEIRILAGAAVAQLAY